MPVHASTASPRFVCVKEASGLLIGRGGDRVPLEKLQFGERSEVVHRHGGARLNPWFQMTRSPFQDSGTTIL
jgi:hypothetical protein